MCLENQDINVRSVVWRVLCQIDDIKDRCMRGYYEQRAEKMRAQKACGDQDLMDSVSQEFPRIDTAEQFYLHYKFMYTEEVTDDLLKDVPRSGFGRCRHFEIDPRTLRNPLFNVLNAYAHYDQEVNYGQGMNMITAQILCYTRQPEQKGLRLFSTDFDNGESEGLGPTQFDEVNSFFILIHLMEDRNWRDVIKPGLPGLKVFIETLR